MSETSMRFDTWLTVSTDEEQAAHHMGGKTALLLISALYGIAHAT